VAIGYWAFQHAQYAYILGAAFIAGLLIILKIKLLKEFRQPPLK
jgi:hypothetical protein